MTITVPATFAAHAARTFGPGGAAWCDGLPGVVDEFTSRWELSIDLPPGAEPWYGMCALVVPVRTAGDPAVLKISWPDEETAHEHLALATWAGHGAVRLLAADPPRRVLLLERLEGDVDLRSVPIDEAVVTLARLLRQLTVPGPAEIDTVTALADRWAESMPRRWEAAGRPCDKRLIDEAVGILRELGPEAGSVMVHTDLHFENVLAAPPEVAHERGRWLAIDPKPMAGEPEFGVLPTLWNRLEDLDGSDERAAVHRRLKLFAEVAGLDAERARAWSLARIVENVIWGAEIGMVESYHRPAWLAEVLFTD